MKRFVKKICVLILILIPLFFVMWVYASVFMESPQKNKQAFEKYFIKHFEEFEVFNIKPYDKFFEISSIQKYVEKLPQLIKESDCIVEKVIETELKGEIKLADKYTIILNEKEFVLEVSSMIKELLNDEKIQKSDIFTKKQIENFKKVTDEYIQKIKNIDENNQIYISVYIRERKPVRTDLVTRDWEFSYQISNKENESFVEFAFLQNKNKVTKYIIEVTNIIKDDIAELSCGYEILVKEEDKIYSDFYRKQNDEFVLTTSLSSENEILKADLKNLINKLMLNAVPASVDLKEESTSTEI